MNPIIADKLFFMVAGERIRAVVGLAHRAAGGGGGGAGLVHDLPRQRVALGTQHHHLHAAVRRHVHGGGGHGDRCDARVVGPGQHEFGALRHAFRLTGRA